MHSKHTGPIQQAIGEVQKKEQIMQYNLHDTISLRPRSVRLQEATTHPSDGWPFMRVPPTWSASSTTSKSFPHARATAVMSTLATAAVDPAAVVTSRCPSDAAMRDASAARDEAVATSCRLKTTRSTSPATLTARMTRVMIFMPASATRMEPGCSHPTTCLLQCVRWTATTHDCGNLDRVSRTALCFRSSMPRPALPQS